MIMIHYPNNKRTVEHISTFQEAGFQDTNPVRHTCGRFAATGRKTVQIDKVQYYKWVARCEHCGVTVMEE